MATSSAINNGLTDTLVTTDTAQTIPGVKNFSNGLQIGGNETLSVYDEGTWTPTLSSTTGTPGAVTYTSQNCTYVKIGKTVTLGMRLAISAWAGSPTGSMIVSLPFPSTSENLFFYGVIDGSGLAVNGNGVGISYIPPASNYLYLGQTIVGTSVVAPINIDTSFTLYLSITYITQ